MPYHRSVIGLRSACECEPPSFASVAPKMTTYKALGRRFERKVAAAMPYAQHGRWFHFEDVNGPGCCSPDLWFWHKSCPFVVEVKHTFILAAMTQITELYAPVMEMVYGRPVRGAVVARNLIPEALKYPLARSWSEALSLAEGGRVVVLGWLGRDKSFFALRP